MTANEADRYLKRKGYELIFFFPTRNMLEKYEDEFRSKHSIESEYVTFHYKGRSASLLGIKLLPSPPKKLPLGA
jgi:hypothetical protein